MKIPSENQKKKIVDFMDNIGWLFDIQNYDRSIFFKKDAAGEYPEGAASIKVDRVYQRITLNIYPVFWDGTKEIQLGYILHELCHNFSDEMLNIARDLRDGKLYSEIQITEANERITSRLTNILGALLDGRGLYAKDAYSKFKK